MSDVRVSVIWQTIHQSPARQQVVDRARLLEQADANVPVGTAPDGLPLVLRVSRSASIIEPVLRALHAGEIGDLSAEARKLLVDLNQRLQSERRALGIADHGPHGHGPHYVSMQSVPRLLGDTLLTRLLGSASPLLLPEDRWAGGGRSDELQAKTSCGVLMAADERVRLQENLASRQHLALPLDDGPAQVVRQRADGTLDMSEGRALVLEDLRHLPSAMFHCYRRDEGKRELSHFQGKLGDNDDYRAAIKSAHCVGWSASRMDLLHVVAEVARSLVPLHKQGLVHGDIKPANILITDDGAIAHDSLDVKAGSISAAGTKGWNAPEQIIAREVSPATDVFALAQLVVQILEAAVFGDERSFVVPVGGGARARERMMVEPDVYLDPNLIPFGDAAISAWRALLRRCLALDASQRVPGADAFADELLAICARHRVPGRRVVAGLAGSLTKNAGGEGLVDSLRRSVGRRDDDAVVWSMDDSYSHLHQMPWQLLFGLAA